MHDHNKDMRALIIKRENESGWIDSSSLFRNYANEALRKEG
jgi:hypothetical protein